MLGWEFPPFISGGLGTACYGLTRALDHLGHRVMFVLPKSVEGSHASHVEMISPDAPPQEITNEGEYRQIVSALRAAAGREPATSTTGQALPDPQAWSDPEHFKHAVFLGVPNPIISPYSEQTATDPIRVLIEKAADPTRTLEINELRVLQEAGVELPNLEHVELAPDEVHPESDSTIRADYEGDVVETAQHYARTVVRMCRKLKFDVIHAHDWMTYPAGLALARITGRPLVTHIHSTEFDRSGEHVNQKLYDIERRGMHAAIRVVAVSMYTRNLCVARYGVDPDKIQVVYNGIETPEDQPAEGLRVRRRDKIVLFLGRITMQKGPEYFVRAAKRVLEKVDNVKFLVAGNGDMARSMIEHAAAVGIGHKVMFTGFLRGEDVSRIFRMADCYVMPSVSEPFGIAPLEAMCRDTPVIISKQSGVSEVLTHALKVDFWDTDEMANKIVAVLRHPPLSQTLREHGSFEVRRLTWEGAAEKCLQVYRGAVDDLSLKRVHVTE